MRVITNIIRLLICLMLQILLFNRLHFLGICHPYIYILFLLAMPIKVPRWAEMLIAAAVGFTMDIVCSSSGVHLAACTLIGFIRPILISWMVQDSERIAQDISSATLGNTEYIRLVIIITFIHHGLIFLLDSWSLAHPFLLLSEIILSSLLTIVLLLGWDSVAGGR
ncbi:MAG: rod shape-determining protein MreD [Paludibacteraceae bacterium]|nr:rod shape-determining protein MreD [Paludibacteraceae bacterium]